LWNSRVFTDREESYHSFSVMEERTDEEVDIETESSYSLCSDSQNVKLAISASMETLKGELSGTRKLKVDLDPCDLKIDESEEQNYKGVRTAKSLCNFDEADLLVPPIGLFTFVLVRSRYVRLQSHSFKMKDNFSMGGSNGKNCMPNKHTKID